METLCDNDSHLWQYLTKFSLKWEMFYTKVVEKIKTHILYSINFFRKSCNLWDNVEKYGGPRGATNDVTILHMFLERWISKATQTHAHMRMDIPTCPGIHMYARTGTCTRQVCNTYCFSTAATICKCASMLRYMYCVCLVGVWAADSHWILGTFSWSSSPSLSLFKQSNTYKFDRVPSL